MKKRTITFGIALSVILAGCQEQENEQTMISQKEQQVPVTAPVLEPIEEIQAPIISEEEAIQTLKFTLTSMQSIMYKLGEDNGWDRREGTDPELTFSMVREAIQHLATDEFIDRVVAEQYIGFYSSAKSFIPIDVNYDVRTTVKQDGDTLHLETFAAAWDYENNGRWQTFDFVYNGEDWILSNWDSRPLDNLALTVEEAEQLTQERYENTDTNISYLGIDDSGDFYLFRIKTENNQDYIRALNRDDTSNYYSDTSY